MGLTGGTYEPDCWKFNDLGEVGSGTWKSWGILSEDEPPFFLNLNGLKIGGRLKLQEM